MSHITAIHAGLGIEARDFCLLHKSPYQLSHMWSVCNWLLQDLVFSKAFNLLFFSLSIWSSFQVC